MSRHDVIGDLRDLASVSLAELTERAALMTRTDRKYLVPAASAQRLLHALDGDVRVLEIDGERTFRYRSTYYDTDDLESYRLAATGRRRRYKVRRRDYLDTSTSFLEVKTLTGRSESAKVRVGVDTARPGTMPLDPAARAFVGRALAQAGIAAPADLVPQLRIDYRRATLLVASEGARLTIDSALTWTALLTDGTDPHVLHGMVVVETKSGAQPGIADRLLWSTGHRPTRISKYATGLALVRGELRANRWHRTLGTLRAA